MADHKRQHYVPRSYLQRFASNSALTTISIGNISSQRLIRGASIRDQCYKNFYYGKSGKLEIALSALEGTSIALFRKIDADDDYMPSASERELLWFYVSTLRGRTEAGELLMASFHEGSAALMAKLYGPEKAQKALEGLRPRRDVVDSLRAHTMSSASLYDLRLLFLKAPSGAEFLTTDAPVVQTNMFRPAMQRVPSPGMITSGLIVILPISPTHCMFAFDEGVYSYRPTSTGRVVLSSPGDVASINRAVSESALRNVYFREETCLRLSIPKRLKELARDDREGRVVLEVYSEVEPGRYVPTSEDAEAGKMGSYLVSHRFQRPMGTVKLDGLNVRLKPRVHETRTAAGLVRDLAWTQIAQEFASLGRLEDKLPTVRQFAKEHHLFARVGGWKAWMD